MAPEVIGRATSAYTEKMDVYSAAIIMWYIATSQRPPMQDPTKTEARPAIKVCVCVPASMCACVSRHSHPCTHTLTHSRTCRPWDGRHSKSF
jgi:serine/threonine protein kinase